MSCIRSSVGLNDAECIQKISMLMSAVDPYCDMDLDDDALVWLIDPSVLTSDQVYYLKAWGALVYESGVCWAPGLGK